MPTSQSRRPALVVLLLVVAACDLPRDADGTLDRVRRGTMRVGVIIDTPWVTAPADSSGAAGGIEGMLAADLARTLGARIEWVRRPLADLMESLHDRELDLVIGGLTANEPWKGKVAFTKPYYTDTIVVGAPAGTPAPDDLTAKIVAVEQGDPVVAKLRDEKARPLLMRDLGEAAGLVAAPSWRLPSLRRESIGIVLGEAQHVLALPPGENAWLVRVERMLNDRESQVPALLRGRRP